MKLLLAIIFSVLVLYANEPHDDISHIRARILEKVLSKISIHNEILVWSDSKGLMSEFNEATIIKTSINCENATLIVLENKENIKESCRDKAIFALKYNLLTDIQRSFGALFWKKGRANIVIIEPRIKAQSIEISKDLEEYLEEVIW